MAAQARTVLLCLAALCLPAFPNVPKASLLSGKPHQGGAGFALASHQGLADAKPLIAPGIAGCLCDEGRRSRSTGKERDAETGMDLFSGPEVDPITKSESVMLRYYSGAQGRFTSPDKPLLDQWVGAPQSWNLFSYVRNNPLSFFDLSGGKCKKTKDGFEGDCVSPGDEKVTEGDKAQQANVRDQQGSTLAYIFSPPVPRYVPNDNALEPNARDVLTQMARATAPIAILADCAAESYLPFATAAGGESIWQLGRDTVPKPFAAGGNPYTSQLAIGSRGIFGSKGGGFPSVIRGANGALKVSNTNFGGFVGRALGPLGRATGVAGLAVGVYQTGACVARN